MHNRKALQPANRSAAVTVVLSYGHTVMHSTTVVASPCGWKVLWSGTSLQLCDHIQSNAWTTSAYRVPVIISVGYPSPTEPSASPGQSNPHCWSALRPPPLQEKADVFHKILRGLGGGVIQGTASEAILVSLLAAQDKILRKDGNEYLSKLTVYASDQTHSVLKKACQVFKHINQTTTYK
ncbi:Tyrosine decarboxylase 1 [Platanthera zijinensis]|uniref:Tyrosine decarboxylase 1 n=1 Tax=Platanthera zijinensis TaxID=2320716 RepID=A0AAP0AVF2_9ASPA